jgi:hypothetical protein
VQPLFIPGRDVRVCNRHQQSIHILSAHALNIVLRKKVTPNAMPPTAFTVNDGG